MFIAEKKKLEEKKQSSMKKRNKNSNVPNLRFPEFQGEWEIYKVSDFLEFFTTNSLSWDQLEYGSENIYNLHYGLIHNGAPALINIEDYKLPTIRQEHVPRAYTLCQNGDIAFADASEDTNDVAKVVEFMDCGEKDIVCGLHTIHGRDKLNITIKGFKGYAFSSVSFHHQMRKLAQGTKVYSVSQKNFSECFIGIPSKEEQTKIAHLLQLIDERISTQNKIIDKLESLIKALNDKLFCPNKDLYPKLRFPCFCKKWENVAIEDILEISNGKDYKHLKEGNIPVYGTGGFMTSVDDYLYDGDSVCIGRKGTIDKPFFYSGKFWTVDTLFYTHSFKNVLPKFCFYIFNRINWLKYNEASGVPSLSKSTIGSVCISVPTIPEQIKLSSFLSLFGDKIRVEKEVLISFQKQRSYLLNKLFI